MGRRHRPHIGYLRLPIGAMRVPRVILDPMGEVIVVTGPPGAGKSTFFELLPPLWNSSAYVARTHLDEMSDQCRNTAQ